MRRNLVANIKRPFLFKISALALGALGAIQVGMWRIRRMYREIDPEGKAQTELKELFKVAKSSKKDE